MSQMCAGGPMGDGDVGLSTGLIAFSSKLTPLMLGTFGPESLLVAIALVALLYLAFVHATAVPILAAMCHAGAEYFVDVGLRASQRLLDVCSAAAGQRLETYLVWSAASEPRRYLCAYRVDGVTGLCAGHLARRLHIGIIGGGARRAEPLFLRRYCGPLYAVCLCVHHAGRGRRLDVSRGRRRAGQREPLP